jgi:hypothetical protein
LAKKATAKRSIAKNSVAKKSATKKSATKKSATGSTTTKRKTAKRAAVKRPAAKQTGKAKPLRAVSGRRPVPTLSRTISRPAAAIAPLALTQAQKSSIFSAIADTPLQPKPIITERVSRPPVGASSSEPATVGAAPPEPVAEAEPVVGERLPPAIALHSMPPRAVAAVPEIAGYHYAFVGDRVLLVDPTNGVVFADIKP